MEILIRTPVDQIWTCEIFFPMGGGNCPEAAEANAANNTVSVNTMAEFAVFTIWHRDLPLGKLLGLARYIAEWEGNGANNPVITYLFCCT